MKKNKEPESNEKLLYLQGKWGTLYHKRLKDTFTWEREN